MKFYVTGSRVKWFDECGLERQGNIISRDHMNPSKWSVRGGRDQSVFTVHEKDLSEVVDDKTMKLPGFD